MKPKYYVVENPTQGRTIEEARRKAIDLALENPGSEFRILMEVCITKVPSSIEFWMDGVELEELE